VTLPFAVGDRVVVRYRLPDGRATDALGVLTAMTAESLVIEGVRGVERVQVDSVLLAKAVPPRSARWSGGGGEGPGAGSSSARP
jgi:hypothetical protein